MPVSHSSLALARRGTAEHSCERDPPATRLVGLGNGWVDKPVARPLTLSFSHARHSARIEIPPSASSLGRRKNTMHPGFIGYWQRHHAGQNAAVQWACTPHSRRHSEHNHSAECHHSAPTGDDGGGFGVRRPLRFLAHKLELSDEQVAKVATVLNALKTERAQAEVDQRRRIAALADVLEADTLEVDQLQSAGQVQVDAAIKLKTAVTQALQQIHAVLDESQRKRLAYLLRTGVLSI